MLSLWKPSDEAVRRFLAVQASQDFTYSAVGATAHTPPAGYVVDHTRACLGTGETTFRAACEALRQWQQFDLGWVGAASPRPTLQVKNLVAVLARAAGLWWLNACRIIYLVDEAVGPITRFGFAYGTLPAHAGSGEERFLIEWDSTDDRVWYDILAFSRPWHPLVRLGYPLVRRTQKRFGRESAAAMQRSVARAIGRSRDARPQPPA